MSDHTHLFNTPLEAGLRALSLLTALFPRSLQLDQLVMLDHIVVHTGDFGDQAPQSLHPLSPYRRAEPVVRRELVRNGRDHLVGRNLIQRLPTDEGFAYSASEESASFLSALQSAYWQELFTRTAWAAEEFGERSSLELSGLLRERVETWVAEFADVAGALGVSE